MKINILEDTVDGDIKDGSIDMHSELNKLLKKIADTLDVYKIPEVGALFEAEAIPVGRFSMTFDESKKELRWYLVGYYNEETPIQQFEFSRHVIANAYRYLVRRILTEFPEIESYNDLLSEYKIYAYDLDCYTADGIITGTYFFRDEPTYSANFTAEWPLNVYLRDVDEIAASYVIPHDIKFEPTFASEYQRVLKRTHQLAKTYQKGTFEGHHYQFGNCRVTIGNHHHAYDTANKIMKSQFYTAISYYFLHVDGKPIDDKYIRHYDRAEKGTNEETDYHDRLIKKLEEILKNFGVYSVG